MKNLKHLLFFLVNFLLSPISSQHFSTVNGLVQDSMDSVALEFAHVYIKGSTIGTYANSEGNFLFNYPDSLVVDTLVISRVGYQPFEHKLSDINHTEGLRVYLSISKNYLDEVVIYSTPDTLSRIIRQTFKNFRKNYPTKLHYLEGFYRELSLKGDQYTRLVEASIGVTENSYRRKQTNTKIKVRQVRKSEDYREYNLKMKLYAATYKKITEIAWGKTWLHYNNIHKLLKSNVAKIDRRKIAFWVGEEYDFVDAYDFTLDKVSEENGNRYYHILFERPPSESNSFTHWGGEMVININDYSIVEYHSALIPHPVKPKKKFDSWFGKKGFYQKSHVIFSKIGKKYYPTFFEMYEPVLTGEKHVYPDGTEEYQYSKVTFMVNQVVSERRDFDRIKKREMLEVDVDLYDMDHPYYSTFWANYNVLLLDPLLKPAKEDLEKEKSLEEQFESNGE